MVDLDPAAGAGLIADEPAVVVVAIAVAGQKIRPNLVD